MAVYFVDIDSQGPIKIGYTKKSVSKRLSNLQVASPGKVSLLASLEGGKLLEKVLHERFRAYHIRGEWFERSDELLDFIETCTDFRDNVDAHHTDPPTI